MQTETRVLLPQLCSRAERRRKGGTSAWPGVGDIGVKAGDAAALVFRRAQPRLASPRLASPRLAIASSSLDCSIALTKSLLGSSRN